MDTRLVSFSGTSGKVIQDSTLLTNDVFLRNGTVTMTGSPNMGANNIIGTKYIESDIAGRNIIWGSGTTISVPPGGNNLRNVYLGYNNDATGFFINAIGNECHQTVGAGNCNLIGASVNIAGLNSSGYGHAITVTGNVSVAIGSTNTITGTSAYVFGDNATNNTAHSMLLGGTSIVNIRPNNNNTCNLGVLSTDEFKTLFSHNHDTSAALSIAPTSATSVAIARSGINTSVLGPLLVQQVIDNTAPNILQIGQTTATSIAIGHAGITTNIVGDLTYNVGSAGWYSSTAYSPAFTIGVATLIPPTAASAGIYNNLFTHSLGVLTYTGLVTRSFRISYNITYVSTPTSGTLTFFNSINGNLVIAGTQSRQILSANASTGGTTRCVSLTDIIVLNSGQTVQLAATSSILSSGYSFTFVSCNISRQAE